MIKRLKIRKKLIVACAISAIIAFACSVFFMVTGFAFFDESSQSNFEITKNQTFVQDDLSGVKLSFKGDTTITLANNLSGDFDIQMRAVPTEQNVADFSSLTIELSDVNTGLGVQFTLYQYVTSETTTHRYAVNMTHPQKTVSLTNEIWNVSSTLNGTGDLTHICFDTDTYELFYYKNGVKTLAFALANVNTLANMGTRTVCDGFENYSLTLTVSGVKNENSAQVLIYSLNGQSFAGDEFVNTAGAVLACEPKLSNGVINKSYKIDTSLLSTCDVLDGLKDGFNGVITAYAPSGQKTVVENGQFIPNEVGEYKICFEGKDSQGVLGQEKTYTIFVYGYHPESEISLSFPIEDVALGVGSVLYIPAASVESELTGNADLPSVTCNFYLGENKIESFLTDRVNEYLFKNEGVYKLRYEVEDVLGEITAKEITITVTSNAPIITFDGVFPNVCVLNQKVIIPSATSSDGKKVSVTTYLPDGRSISSTCFTPDIFGVYKVVYATETHSYVRYFNVEMNAESLWVNVKGTTIVGDVNSPYYSAQDFNAVTITATRENATARFLNPIDLSDNDKVDTLIEFFISPETNGVAEFSGLVISLIDVNDADNFIKISFEKDNYGDLYVIRPYVTTNKISTPINYGVLGKQQSIRGSYSGMFTRLGVTYPANSVKIHFDYKELTLYASLENSSANVYRKFAKLDDVELVGRGNEWKGFSTDSAYLEVCFQKVNSSQANLMVLDVDGQSMSGKQLKDLTPPSIKIDYGHNQADDLPKGVVGAKYPVFDANAYDLVSGVCEKPSVKVFDVTNGNRVRVYECDEKSFIPQNVGVYEIEYTAVDNNGNFAKKVLTIDVVSSLSPLKYEFFDLQDSVVIGSMLYIPDGVCSGGSGNKTIDKKVFFGDEEVDIIDGEFFAEKQGQYTVVVTLTDYLGNQQDFEKKILCVGNDKPVLVNATVPKAVMVGKEIVFPSWSAYEYVDDIKNDLSVKVSVNGQVLNESLKYTFEETGVYTVKFETQGQTGIASETFEIKALSAVEGERMFLKNFFYTENVEISGELTSLNFTATDSNAAFGFANSVSAVQFGLSFSVDSEHNNLSGVRVSITDSINANQKLVFDVNKGAEGSETSLISVNGGSSKEIVGSFFGTTVYPFYLKYDNKTFEVKDYSDNLLMKVDQIGGKKWTGFESEKVYVHVEFIDYEVGSMIKIIDLNNQTFGENTTKDRIAPQIFYSNVDKVMNFGDTLKLLPAKAYDVLGEVAEFTVSVTSPSLEVVIDKADATKEHSFTFNEYGEYYIEYLATDTSGRSVPRTMVVTIKNRQLPSIQINGKVVEKAKLKSTVKLPNATFDSSDGKAKLFVTVIKPNGYTFVVQNYKFIPDIVGKYKVIYFVIDGYGNSVQKVFYINAV